MKNQNIMFKGISPHMSKVRLVRPALALGILALILQVSVPCAQAFDVSSLNGGYADSYEVLVPANSHQVLSPISTYSPYFTVALWTFDGAGGFTGRLVLNFGGGVVINQDFDQNITGTYDVNGNGTGTMNYTASGVPRRRHFVIGDGGNQLKYHRYQHCERRAGRRHDGETVVSRRYKSRPRRTNELNQAAVCNQPPVLQWRLIVLGL